VTADCEAYTYFDHELICLLADDVQNEGVTIHRSHEVKILSHYTDILCTGRRDSAGIFKIYL
jgi:hypothetical protein